MNGKKRKRPLFGAFSFVFIYCWYLAYWRYFEDSHVAASLHSWGFGYNTLMAWVSVSVIAGIAVSLCPPWSRLIGRQMQPLKLMLHLLAFIPFQMFTLFSSAAPVIALALVGGFCIGAVTGRSIYTMFIEIMDVHPAKVIVVGYSIIQAYVHITDIVPLVSIPPLYYSLSAATLLAGIVMSYLRRDGDEMERRRVLPENRVYLEDIWPILLMITLLETCLALYEYVILYNTDRSPASDTIKIIYTVVMLLFLARFGKRLTLTGTLAAFLALFACVVGAFIIFGASGRVAIQIFMEPAYRLLDFLLIWIMTVVAYTYGRNQYRLKACIVTFFVVRFGALVACSFIFSSVQPTAEIAYLLLLPMFLTALLIHPANRAVRNMEDRRAYAEKQQGPEAPLPPEREDILASSDALLHTLPEGVTLTSEEQAALAYLIDGQFSDVTAYFMDVPPQRVRALNGSVFEKFGVKSVHELMVALGAAKSGADGNEKREAIFRRYALTERERQITHLLLAGVALKNIAGELGISEGTVNTHSRNLYRKLGIQSRSQIAAVFAGTVPEVNKTN